MTCDANKEKTLDNGRLPMVGLDRLSGVAADLRRHALGLAKAASNLEKDIQRERDHATR